MLNETGFAGGFKINRSFDAFGAALTQGWTVNFENYSNTEFQLQSMEIIFHGSPIGANTQRVQGLIGVDDNRNDEFNFSRVNQFNFDTDGILRYGEVFNVVDVTHESMGANITVLARRASDGIIVDQFVTGADGNYYFDLVPDDYIISIVDPQGRAALDDSLTAAGFLQDYKTEWTISADFFKVWDYDANLEVPLQADGTPFSFLDIFGSQITDGIQNLNFLLDPGAPAAPQADFSGVVFADINGDGIFNGDDVNVPEVNVFGDVNRNGQFDSGEVITTTNINGEYSLTIPVSAATVVNIGVIAPPNWSLSDPVEGSSAFFVQPGDGLTGVDFAITPPVGASPGNGTGQPGYLLGVVFDDANGDGVRQATELGQSGIDVFIDSNASGSFELGERITTTNVNGGFIFANVAPGAHMVRIEIDPPFEQISPAFGGAQVVALAGGGSVSNILFGVGNTATLDFGDLPAIYGVTLLEDDGARHPKGVYFLGTLGNDIDAEVDGQESDDALGDDNVGNDEDGIVVDDLVEGALGRLVATAVRHGGYLKGWVDFNGDGDFDDVGERIITNQLLLPGANEVFFAIPGTIEADRVFARFRYGEFGIDSVTGAALIGEVEDYELSKETPASAPLVFHGPDFDDDNDVDGLDFLAWQLGFGAVGSAVTAADGDSNSDNAVDGSDFADWSAEFGGGSVTATATPESGDFDEDGDTDGIDFLSWQTGFGSFSASVSLSDGDGNESYNVDSTDLSIWSENFGENSGGSPVAATAGGSGESGSSSSSLPVAAQAPLASPSEIAALNSTAAASTTIASVETTIAPTPVATPNVVASTANVAESTSQNDTRQAALASLAGTVQSSEDFGSARLRRRFSQPRFETLSSETTYDHSVEVANVGVALRDRVLGDRVLDRLFSIRQRPLVGPLEQLHDNEHVAEEALALALGEEIDWRFL